MVEKVKENQSQQTGSSVIWHFHTSQWKVLIPQNSDTKMSPHQDESSIVTSLEKYEDWNQSPPYDPNCSTTILGRLKLLIGDLRLHTKYLQINGSSWCIYFLNNGLRFTGHVYNKLAIRKPYHWEDNNMEIMSENLKFEEQLPAWTHCRRVIGKYKINSAE